MEKQGKLFVYGGKEIDYLKRRDKKLGAAIDIIGPIDRPVDGDVFASVVRHIIGQQISKAAQMTVWGRLRDALGEVNAATVSALPFETLQKFGMTFKKAAYIKNFAQKVIDREFDPDALAAMSDAELLNVFTSLDGVGMWTAEMIMIFCLGRPDIVSYGDLAIRRGMRMLYRRREIDKKTFARYAARYSPCGSVASLYLWAIAGGAIPELKDCPPKKKAKK